MLTLKIDMIKYFLIFNLAFLPLFAEKRIEYIGLGDGHELYQALKARNINVGVVKNDWEKLGEGFRKNNSFWGKFKRRWIGENPIQLDPDIQKIVFMNMPNHLYRDYQVRNLPKDKLVLFMWEPPMHEKKMYYKKLHDCIGRVYTWDDDLVDNIKYFKFYYPVLTLMLTDIPSFEEKKFCTMIAGANLSEKFPKEFPDELYTARKNIVVFFEQSGEKGFDLYGRGWDSAVFPSYRGKVSDKLSVMKQYRFAICYENTQNIRGYVTEKIFDCFAAGTIPVYLGATNITDYVPKDCFIDRRDFATLEELHVFLKQMDKTTFDGYIQRIAAYLQSDQAQLFSQENFNTIFADAVTH
jgi:alpha(1,3/1,4) fucosyltransferase